MPKHSKGFYPSADADAVAGGGLMVRENVAAYVAAQVGSTRQLVSELEAAWTDALRGRSASRGKHPVLLEWIQNKQLHRHEDRDVLPLFLDLDDRYVLNADLAAALAGCTLRLRDVNRWFAAVNWTRRKDLLSVLAVNASTISRKADDEELGTDVTERLLRHSELMVRATEVFGSEAETWLGTPHPLLGGKTPLLFASNEYGAAKVRALLNAAEYGGVV